MIMIRAIGQVVHDIANLIQRCAARMARKALLMIPARQAIVRGFDGAPTDLESATSTFWFRTAAGAGDQ